LTAYDIIRTRGKWLVLMLLSSWLSYYLMKQVSVAPTGDAPPLQLGAGWRDLAHGAVPPEVHATVVGLQYAEDLRFYLDLLIPATVNASVVFAISGIEPGSCKAELWKRRNGILYFLSKAEAPGYEHDLVRSTLVLVTHRIEAARTYDALSIECRPTYKPHLLSYSQRRVRLERFSIAQTANSGFLETELPSSPLYVSFSDQTAYSQIVNGKVVEDQTGTRLESSILVDWTKEDLAQRRDFALIAVGAILGLVGACIMEMLK